MADGGSKSLLGLLNGIARHDFYGDDELSDDVLKQELYTEMPEQEFSSLIHKCRGIVKVSI